MLVLVSSSGNNLESVPESLDPALVAVLLPGVDVEPQVLVRPKHRVNRHRAVNALCRSDCLKKKVFITLEQRFSTWGTRTPRGS